MWPCGFLNAYFYSKNWMFAVTQVKQKSKLKLKTQSQLRAYSAILFLGVAKEYNRKEPHKNFSDYGARVVENKGIGSFFQRPE